MKETLCIAVCGLLGVAALGCGPGTLGGPDGAPADAAGGSDAGTDAAPATDAGPPPPPDFSCLGMNAPPPPVAATAAVTFTVGEAVTPGVAEQGVTVDAFARADVAETTVLDSSVTDATGGSLVLPLGTAGFDGFLRLAGAPGDMLRTTYYYQNKAVTADGDLGALIIVGETSWIVLPGIAGVTQSPGFGAVGLQVVDCAGVGVPGATVALSASDPMTVVRYVTDGIPNEEGTATDESGSLVVFDALVGPLTLTLSAPPLPGGMPVLVGAITLDVRADVLTAAFVTPD
jgi:hypothetical protein